MRTDGSSTACDGSADAAFSAGALGACAVSSVQKGVDNVQPSGTVRIGAGAFNGADAAVFTSKSVTIQGASRTTTILDGTGLTGQVSGIQFNAGTSGATVKDLTVQDFPRLRNSCQGPLTNFTVDNTETYNNGIGNAVVRHCRLGRLQGRRHHHQQHRQ